MSDNLDRLRALALENSDNAKLRSILDSAASELEARRLDAVKNKPTPIDFLIPENASEEVQFLSLLSQVVYFGEDCTDMSALRMQECLRFIANGVK